MARQHPGLVASFPTTSTGLVRFQFASMSTSGNLIACTTDLVPFGVFQEGSTGSTTPPASLPVMLSGISKLSLDSASTVGVGQLVSASTVGAKTPVAGDYVAGFICEGTSGSGARIVSVWLAGPNYSTATA